MTPDEESAICFSCGGKCCKNMRFGTYRKDHHLRYDWLASPFISSRQIDGTDIYVITFSIPCIKLVDGKCQVHDTERPGYCKDYPRNFIPLNDDTNRVLLLEEEKEFCPLLRTLIKERIDSPYLSGLIASY